MLTALCKSYGGNESSTQEALVSVGKSQIREVAEGIS